MSTRLGRGKYIRRDFLLNADRTARNDPAMRFDRDSATLLPFRHSTRPWPFYAIYHGPKLFFVFVQIFLALPKNRH
jgi:hypothetical protein